MPRIVGVDIPERKKLKVALRSIYGVGPTRADEICQLANLDPDMRAQQLSDADASRLANIIQDAYMVEGDLRRQRDQDIRRLTAIGCYRGLRHRRALPVRGQRTRTNARTRKGRRMTVGAIRDKATRRAAKG